MPDLSHLGTFVASLEPDDPTVLGLPLPESESATISG